MNRGWNLKDNIRIERFFRNLKSEKIYTEDIQIFDEAREAIEFYIPEYNFYRGHSALDDKTPSEIFGCYRKQY
jgi:transposase InsO family protein